MASCASIHRRVAIKSDVIRGMLAEMAGTFILVLFVDAGLAQAIVSGWTAGTQVSTALSSGLGVAFGIYTGVGVSGGHVNPAITVGLATVGKFPWRRVPAWILAQFVGAFAAAFVVFGIYLPALNHFDGGNRTVFGPTGTAAIFCTFPQPYFGMWVALAEQIINTGLLLHCTLVFFDDRNSRPKRLEPLFVGMSVMAIILAWGHNAGAPLNPARDVAGRVLTFVVGYGTEVWIPYGVHWWWVPTFVPLLGGMCGATFYFLLVEIHHPKDTDELLVSEEHIEMEVKNTPAEPISVYSSQTQEYDNPSMSGDTE